MEENTTQQEVKEAACALVQRLKESASTLVVRYDDEKKPETMVPAQLQQYLVSCLRALCAVGMCAREEGRQYTARKFHNGTHKWQVYFYRNGIVNVYMDGDLIAAADVRKQGELEEAAFKLFADRLLNSLRVFV